MPPQEQIEIQQQHLNACRRSLMAYTQQQARYGRDEVPSYILQGTQLMREKIQDIKAELQSWGIEVDNHPADPGMIRFAINFSRGTVELNHNPPLFAMRLLRYLPMNSDAREAVEGDLAEEYRAIYDQSGRREADIWYYCQVRDSLWPYIVSGAQKLLRQGVFGWMGDVIRRFIP